jgi:type I restriction enzyme, S subunit
MSWKPVTLGQVVSHRKDFITIDDVATYRRPRVQLHARGIVLRDEVPGGLIKTKNQQVCRQGEFLVAEIDAKVGGYGVVPPNLDGAIVSSHYFLFTVDETQLKRHFLNYFIQTPAFRSQVEAQGSTNYAAVRPSDVLGYTIPLPSLSEQQRIVERIDQIAARIDRAMSLRNAAQTELEALSGAVSRCRFEGSWPKERLEDLCLIITDGTHQTPRYVEEGRIFLSAQNVKPFRFMPKKHRKVSEEDFLNYTRNNKPQKGDVLLTRVGAGIGEATVVDQDIEFAIYVSLALLRPDSDRLLAEYLVHWLNSPVGRECSRRETLGKGHSQGNLNLKLLRDFKIPMPSLAQQRKIVGELESLQRETDELRDAHSEMAAELNALLPAVLSKAFAGGL